jgi:hypothetical protein
VLDKPSAKEHVMAVQLKTIALRDVGEEWLHAWLNEGIIPLDVYREELERRSKARAKSAPARRWPLAVKRDSAGARLRP